MSISTAARSFCLSHRARHLLAAVLSKKSAGDLQEGTAQIRIWVVPSLFKQPRLHETTRFSRTRLRRAERLCYTSGMPDFAAPVERLIDELKHLPGIGQKTAQRLAFFILRAAPEDALGLADAIREAKERIRECSVCSNITENDPCHFCTGASRDKKMICVVEEAHNIMAIEKTRTYSGMYHVLGGSLSPLSGRGPEQLRIKSLIERLKGGTVEE